MDIRRFKATNSWVNPSRCEDDVIQGWLDKTLERCGYTLESLAGRGLVAHLRKELRYYGLCKDCKEQPRHVTKSVKMLPYCSGCWTRRCNASQALTHARVYKKHNHYRMDGLCSRCGVAPKARSGGYCVDCNKAYYREQYANNKARNAQRKRQVLMNEIHQLEAGPVVQGIREGLA